MGPGIHAVGVGREFNLMYNGLKTRSSRLGTYLGIR